jgi:toxin ParE1/3/4
VREAAGWYDRRSPGLGDAFVDAVRRSVSEIIEDPERFAMSPAGYVYIRLRRFPYVMLFDLVDNELLMLAVLHTARSMENGENELAVNKVPPQAATGIVALGL